MSELAFRLVRTNGPESFDLEVGNRYVLGRGPSSDFPVPDPTISRRHAELCVTLRRAGSRRSRQQQRHPGQRQPGRAGAMPPPSTP